MTTETVERTRRVLRPLNLTPTPVTRPFKVNQAFLNKGNGQVKIYDWGRNFGDWFVDKEETGAPAPLSVYVIEPEGGSSYAYDRDIVADLGGEEVAKIAMADFWDQIVIQGHGQPGQLHVDGRANIGYAEDAKGVFRVVSADRFWDGWLFDAYGFPDPSWWDVGDHVLAPRNS